MEDARFAVHGIVSPFVGRVRELAALNAVLAKAVEGRAPQIVTLLGNQGTGKSRLIREWTARLDKGVRVYAGAASERNARYSAVARLLRSRFGLVDSDDSTLIHDRLREALQAVYGDRRVGEVLHFLASFLGVRIADSPFLRAFEDNPRQHDDVARAVLRRFLETDAASGPLVLILDNLDVADDDTLTLVHELAEQLDNAALVLVTVARPELLVRRTQWGAGGGDHTRLELRNFDPAEAGTLLRNLLARCDKIPAELVEDAVEMTGGNPFFLEELVRVFIAEGTIDTRGETWRIDADRAASTELPISVEEAIEARIAALDRAERDLLERGAVFGNVFWIGAAVALERVEQLAGSQSELRPAGWIEDGLEAALLARVDRLVERDYLLRLPVADSSIAGEIEVVFKHNLERELVARSTDPERRRRYHRVAAQWLEAKLLDRTDEQLEFLAQLHERGGEPRRAAQAYLAAGDRARARFANLQAVDFYTRGLNLLGEDDAVARMDALHNLGDVLALTGRTVEAAQQFLSMLRVAWLLNHAAKGGAAHGRIGRVHRQRGDYEPALEHFHQALALFERSGDRRGVAGALDDIGRVYALRSDYNTARSHHERALAIRRQLGDRRSIALSLANIGRVFHDSGEFRLAVERFREALAMRREAGDRVGEISSLCDLAEVLGESGDLNAARAAFLEGLRLAGEVGDRGGEVRALLQLAQVEHELGLPEAVARLERAEEIASAAGDRLGEAQAARRLAEIKLGKGDHAGAAACAHRGFELATRLGARVLEGAALALLGEATVAERDRADGYFRAALQTLVEVKAELELARAYRAYARFKEAHGEGAEAERLRLRADEIFGRLRGAARPRG